MEVIVYTKPGCDSSRRIKEILEDRGVEFQEHVCADGKLDGRELKGVTGDARNVPFTVIDGVAISGMNRAQIEQAIGWVGF
ncbi:MAG: glutaredoxin family protein [Candidatus Dormibacteraeota bacterium]|nr:glutaredoxin family protein [Candidatus Dormibacteraeota bacterium]